MKRILNIMLGLTIVIFIVIIIMIASWSISNGQMEDPRINKEKPTVYIKALNHVIQKDENGIEEDAYRLAFYNNSKWKLFFFTRSESMKDGDYPVLYNVVDDKGCIVHYFRTIGSILMFPLKSGKSVTFIVPKKYLLGTERVSVEFQYEWEIENTKVVYKNEPAHIASFSTYQIPKELK